MAGSVKFSCKLELKSKLSEILSVNCRYICDSTPT